MIDINVDLLQWFTNFLIKCSGANTSGCLIKTYIMSNYQLAEELHKPLIIKLEKHKVYSSFKTMFEVLTWQVCNL